MQAQVSIDFATLQKGKKIHVQSIVREWHLLKYNCARLIEQTRDELEAAGELPEVTDPYVYEQHIDIDEDEENEDSLHKFYLKVRPWPKLGLMRIPGAKALWALYFY